MTYEILVRLPAEARDAFTRIARRRGLVPAVLARTWLLERLERNRVLHLASSQRQLRRAQDANERVQKRDQLLDRMLHSRAFWAAEMILRLRHSDPVFSRQEIREVMDDVERPIP